MTADLPMITPAPSVLPPAAMIAVAAGLTFAAFTIWVARQGSAVPGVDEHAHS